VFITMGPYQATVREDLECVDGEPSDGARELERFATLEPTLSAEKIVSDRAQIVQYLEKRHERRLRVVG
jgi:hypothetical protein